jgi:hypothetical protein
VCLLNLDCIYFVEEYRNSCGICGYRDRTQMITVGTILSCTRNGVGVQTFLWRSFTISGLKPKAFAALGEELSVTATSEVPDV